MPSGANSEADDGRNSLPGGWRAAAEEERVQSILSCPDKCGTDAWRGRFCQYHQGFVDGIDIAIDLHDSAESGPVEGTIP